MKLIKMISPFLLFFLFTGCASYSAKNHLKNKELEQGIKLTTEELKSNPDDTYLNYYHGRFLYKQKKYGEAIPHLKVAAESFPYDVYHKLWLGVAYGKNKNYKKEREIYLDILNQKGRYKRALIYLGKNYYKTKDYKKAKETFEKALVLYKKHSYMFYYYALTLKKLKQYDKSKEYFFKYLNHYAHLSLAKSAIYNLNRYGDFTYSNFIIGEKTASIRNMNYLNNSNDLESYSKESLDKISELIKTRKDLVLYIVSYDKSSLKTAETKVKNIKKYLLNKYPEIGFSNIKIAWLKTNKKIKIGKKEFSKNQYVNFFTTAKKDNK